MSARSATLIAKRMEKVGKEGVITADGKTLENELEVVEGMKFERAHLAVLHHQPQDAEVRAREPLRLIFEKKIRAYALLPVLESVLKTQRPLLIIAEDVESRRSRRSSSTSSAAA